MFPSGPAKKGAHLPAATRQGFRKAFHKLGLAFVLASALWGGTEAQARTNEVPLPAVAVAALPEQAQQTYRRVFSGGPFRYHKDGTVFGNREHRLPSRARGYYREYTVPTPGSADRGARRIICGGQQPTEPDACFYTDDHYASFRLIAR